MPWLTKAASCVGSVGVAIRPVRSAVRWQIRVGPSAQLGVGQPGGSTGREHEGDHRRQGGDPHDPHRSETPNSRSSSAIVCAESTWWTVAIPSSAAGGRLNGRSSTNTHAAGAKRDRSRAALVDLRGRLAHADLPGDDDAVEQPRQQFSVIAPGAPGVGDETGADALRPRPRDGGLHRLVGDAAGEQAVDQPGGGDTEHLGEARLELLLGERSGLQPDEQLPARRVRAKAPADGVGVDAVRLAERPEGVKDVGRHHPAPVDEQALEAARPVSPGPSRPPSSTK